MPVMREAIAELMKRYSLAPADFSKVAFYAHNQRAHAAFAKTLGFDKSQIQARFWIGSGTLALPQLSLRWSLPWRRRRPAPGFSSPLMETAAMRSFFALRKESRDCGACRPSRRGCRERPALLTASPRVARPHCGGSAQPSGAPRTLTGKPVERAEDSFVSLWLPMQEVRDSANTPEWPNRQNLCRMSGKGRL